MDGTCDHQNLLRRNVTGLFGVRSVFGRRIKGMIRLLPEQVSTCNVTRHHRPLLCRSFLSWYLCLEEWCESLVLCGFLSVLAIVKWTQVGVIEFIEMAFLNAVSFFEIFSPIKLIKNSNSLGDILVKLLYNSLTGWKFKSTSKLEPLFTSLLVYSCLCHHRRYFLFFFKAWYI